MKVISSDSGGFFCCCVLVKVEGGERALRMFSSLLIFTFVLGSGKEIFHADARTRMEGSWRGNLISLIPHPYSIRLEFVCRFSTLVFRRREKVPFGY